MYVCVCSRLCAVYIVISASSNDLTRPFPTRPFPTRPFLTRPPPPSVVCDNRAFLKFEFNGNVVDSSCTKATAHVAHGNVVFITSPYGKAATFNGNAYLAVSTWLYSCILYICAITINVSANIV